MLDINLTVHISPDTWRLLEEVVASLSFATLFFLLWPTNLIGDDGGITLRYMDNFSKGYFYSYNPSDGPIFGVSSFLHGIVGGFFASFHLLSPLNSLLASNYIGLFLTSLAVFRLTDFYTRNRGLALLFWMWIMLSSAYFVINVKQGLETPLHIAIILACVLLLLYKKPRLMWLAFVVAIISKLDALPIVGVLFLVFVWQNRTAFQTLSGTKKISQDFLLFGVIPGIAWLLISYMIFGGPFPQSAYVKLFYYPHDTRHWFPFIEPMIDDVTSRMFLLICSGLSIAYLVYCFWAKRTEGAVVVLSVGLAVLAELTMYYFYNPVERHPWYYALPDLFIKVQIAIIICVFLERLASRYQMLAGCAAVLLLASWTVPQDVTMTRDIVNSMNIVETERIAIGQWIKANSTANDTLLAGHGHIAREAGLYTIDYSGINSRVAVNYRLNLAKMIVELQPNWIAMHGLLSNRLRDSSGYSLRKSYYNITIVGFPTWRIYERVDKAGKETTRPLLRDMIKTDGAVSGNGFTIVSGTTVTFGGFEQGVRRTRLVMGLRKPSQEMRLTAAIYGDNQSLLREVSFGLDRRDEAQPVDGLTTEWSIELEPDWNITSIVITVAQKAGTPEQVQLVDPIFLEAQPE